MTPPNPAPPPHDAPPATVQVRVDDRLRLMSAVLAATPYPDHVQQQRPHGSHRFARLLAQHVAPMRAHSAARSTEAMLGRGTTLEALFTLAVALPWPGLRARTLPPWVPAGWDQALWDFYERADLAAWWADPAGAGEAWADAHAQAARVFDGVALAPFLAQFVGPLEAALVFMPNIAFPSERELGLRLPSTLWCVSPPRLAWGDSPPWPFDEDAADLRRVALSQFTRLVLRAFLRQHVDAVKAAQQHPLPVSEAYARLHPTWADQFVALFTAAALTIYLQDHMSDAEAQAFALMERKLTGLAILPGAVSVLRHYQDGHAAGRSHTIAELLPRFALQLKVAKTIVSL